jgi:sec-independent protein translocase protein TatA
MPVFPTGYRSSSSNLPLTLTLDAVMGLSPLHLFIILIVVLLLFGNRLPSVMRSLGEGVVEFKKGMQGIEDDKDRSAKEKEKIE